MTLSRLGYDDIFLLEIAGNILSNYSSNIYPTKDQWALASGLSENKITKVVGDLPATFIYRQNGEITKDTTIEFNNKTIIIQEDCSNLIWDSRLGIITAEVGDELNKQRRPILYSGNACDSIEVGTPITETGSITYQFWYY